MSLVGKKAPLFINPAIINGDEIVEGFSLEQFIGSREVLFIFYVKDFSIVCPTELLAFQNKLEEFKKREVEVIGCSTDTEETHLAWLNLERERGGIKGVTFPLVVDTSKTIASNFGILAGDWNYKDDGTLNFTGSAVAHRATFFIDREGLVRYELVNDISIGRNINEYLRIIDAWHHIQKTKEVCPANWQKGDQALKPNRNGLIEYMANQ